MAGRRRLHSKGVAHTQRESVNAKMPLHVNFKLKARIRNKTCYKILKRAIRNSRSHGLKIIHYSLQSNHIHLILEAISNEILTRGMRSLCITFAKGLKMGRVQVNRYHLHVLRSSSETKNAIRYVLFNHQKHAKTKEVRMDFYCSIRFINKIQNLVRNNGMKLIFSKVYEKNFLDQGGSLLFKISMKKLLS